MSNVRTHSLCKVVPRNSRGQQKLNDGHLYHAKDMHTGFNFPLHVNQDIVVVLYPYPIRDYYYNSQTQIDNPDKNAFYECMFDGHHLAIQSRDLKRYHYQEVSHEEAYQAQEA